jgi:hypothetical protein
MWRRYLSNSGLNSIIFDALNTICFELLESLKYPSSSNIAPRNEDFILLSPLKIHLGIVVG